MIRYSKKLASIASKDPRISRYECDSHSGLHFLHLNEGYSWEGCGAITSEKANITVRDLNMIKKDKKD